MEQGLKGQMVQGLYCFAKQFVLYPKAVEFVARELHDPNSLGKYSLTAVTSRWSADTGGP